MRKVLIFSLAYYPHLVGGAEVSIKEITDRLGADFEFDMITLNAGKTRVERMGNVNVYRVGPRISVVGNKVPHISYLYKFYYVAAAFLKAVLLHRKRQYDLTYSVMASFNAFSNLFFKITHPRIPFVLNLQEGDTALHIKKMTSVMYPVYKYIFKKADLVVAISSYLESYGKSMGATCPSFVIPNGVHYSFFAEFPAASHLKALRHELDLHEDDVVLITTSRLVPKNAVNDSIDSLTHLPLTYKLLVLGTGPLEELLREKVRLLKLEGRVKFVGYVPHNELPLYLHAAHIFVRPSLSEGMGVSFVEAMAAGIPVVATAVGGIPDFIRNNETGLFCEVGNGKSVAEKVKVLMNDQPLRETIIKNAREMVKEKYDWDLISDKTKEIWGNVMQSPV